MDEIFGENLSLSLNDNQFSNSNSTEAKHLFSLLNLRGACSVVSATVATSNWVLLASASPCLTTSVAEVVHKLVRPLGSLRGREVTRTSLFTSTTPAIPTEPTPISSRMLLVSRGKVWVALFLAEVWHVAVALAYFVRLSSSLIRVLLATILV